jgi:hypothetical protein
MDIVGVVSMVFLTYFMKNKSDSRQVLIDHGLDPFFKIMDKVLDPKYHYCDEFKRTIEETNILSNDFLINKLKDS